MNGNIPFHMILSVLNQRPQAAARVHGSSAYPTLSGCVYFYQMAGGVLVVAQVTGLPKPTPDFPWEMREKRLPVDKSRPLVAIDTAL